jgi:hypothetical protein
MLQEAVPNQAGGSAKLIFTSFDMHKSQRYFSLGKKLTPAQQNVGIQRTRIDIPVTLNGNVSYGVQNNFEHRNYVLTTNDIELDKAFHFPAKSDRNSPNALAAASSS